MYASVFFCFCLFFEMKKKKNSPSSAQETACATTRSAQRRRRRDKTTFKCVYIQGLDNSIGIVPRSLQPQSVQFPPQSSCIGIFLNVFPFSRYFYSCVRRKKKRIENYRKITRKKIFKNFFLQLLSDHLFLPILFATTYARSHIGNNVILDIRK